MAFKFNPTTGKLDTVADPAGSDTQIQFNDSGEFGGDADLTWNKTTNVLTNKGDISLDDGGSFTTTLQVVTPTANRTISLPNATGTVGLVSGSSGQLIWNSSGAYAGVSTSSIDGSGNITLSGRMINSTAGAASAPPSSVVGTWFTGGSATTTKPQFLVEPTGTTSTAWSTSGTGIGVNAPSGFSGRLLDLQLNGTSNFSVSSAGATTGASFIPTSSTVPTNGVYLPASNEIGWATNSTARAKIDSSGRFLFGATTARSNLYGATVSAKFQIESNDGSVTEFLGLRNVNNATSPEFVLAKSRGATIGSNTIVQQNDNIGAFIFQGADGTFFQDAAYVLVQVDGTPGSADMPGRISLWTTPDGAKVPVERFRITNEGVIGRNQPAPAAVDTTATLTIANLKTGIITSSTAAAVTMTLPTGTLTEGGFSGLYDKFTFEWSVINTGATNDVTVAEGTAHTLIGSATVAASTTGRFASRRTASNTFVTYRIS